MRNWSTRRTPLKAIKQCKNPPIVTSSSGYPPSFAQENQTYLHSSTIPFSMYPALLKRCVIARCVIGPYTLAASFHFSHISESLAVTSRDMVWAPIVLSSLKVSRFRDVAITRCPLLKTSDAIVFLKPLVAPVINHTAEFYEIVNGVLLKQGPWNW